MVLQMGQGPDDTQDRLLIEYLSKNALAIQHHPGAVQFQVSKNMLCQLKKQFGNMRTTMPSKDNPINYLNNLKNPQRDNQTQSQMQTKLKTV